MPLTTLDLKTALIVVDLQKGIVAMASTNGVTDVVKKAAALTDAFRKHDLPIVLVNVDGVAPGRAEQARRMGELPADWADIVPELKAQSSDHRVTKKTWGAFTNTDLEAYLKKKAITQVVIVGVATSIGVESTARFAQELGFNITFAIDAMTDLNPDAHANSITRIFPRMGETGTTQDVLDLLAKRSA